MAFSNLVALAIMVTTAATLHVAGVTEATQAAEALKLVAGAFAFVVFTLGIVGTGLFAVPVLAGSAAYALGEARQWPTGLARKPMEAKAFYATILLATMIGVGMNFSSISPITANPGIMGKFPVSGVLKTVGWAATFIMAAAVAGMGIAASTG
jgi:Mn2+/Fe2+ NRAMP family transporter